MNITLLRLAILLPVLLSGCQQSMPQPASPVAPEAQAQQLSAVVAATRYLRNQCGQQSLPDNARIEQAARAEAKKRGWQPPADLTQRSDTFYQQLISDSTPPAEQCAEFSRGLMPFITTLPKA